MKRLFLLPMLVLLFLNQGRAQIKITEIMYNPSSTEDNWEYVELYNAGANPVDLSGYVLDDGNTWFLNSPNIAGGIIPAKGTAVLFNDDDIDAADFQAAWGNNITLIAVSNWERLGLNNSGDDIAIWSSFAAYASDTAGMSGITFSNAVSHVAFDDDGTIWPLDDGSGSIRLKDVNADVSVGSNWALSVASDGVSKTSSNAGGNSGADVGSPGIQAANTFTLQLLHYADVDGNEEVALDAVDEFSGIVNGLKNDPTYGSQTLLVTSGDIIIPGPRFFAAENNKVRALTGCNEPGHIDVYFANKMGVDASAIGNHELDAGPAELHDAAFASESSNGILFPGSEFVWLATNIDFTNDPDFQNSIGTDGANITSLKSKVAKYAIKVINGDTIGIVGASVPTLPTITSTGDLEVIPGSDWTVQSLAFEIQKSVDALKNMGVNKIILISHMQQISVEKSLANLLNGVDIIVAGGSNTRMGDNTDALYTSAKITDASFDEAYPFLTNSANGDPVAVVNVDGDYKYLGRLVVEFDAQGKMIISSLDKNISGVYASTAANVTAVNGSINQNVLQVRDSVLAVINAQYQNVIGYSSVYLDGRRSQVRTQETNLGNLTADANLWYANQLNPTGDAPVLVSIKNGGGIRTEIGTSKLPPGSNDPADMEFFAPDNNAVSEGHLRATLRFNNGLVRLTLTAEELKDVMEHAVSGVSPGGTPGSFPQIAGMRIVYNPMAQKSQVGVLKAANGSDSLVVTQKGKRIVSLVIEQPNAPDMTIVHNGQLVVDPTMAINVVTLNFLANGGDAYPFTIANFSNRRINYYSGAGFGESVDFPDGELANDPGLSSNISSTGGEQDAMAEYMLANYPSYRPYDIAEEDIFDDQRISRTLHVLDANPAPFINTLQVKAAGKFQVPGNVFDAAAAEIPAYDAARQQVFFTDANSDKIHVLDIKNPASPSLKSSITLTGSPNSVAVYGDIVAVAVEASPKQNPGKVEFYSAVDFSKLGEVTVGALPDMVCFNADGTKVLTANEGEPSGDYLNDPEGSVSIITLNTSNLSASTVATADFTSFNGNIPTGVRVFGRSSKGEGDKADGFATTLAQDIEPEYITVKGNKAYVTCQENNALAIININTAVVESLLPLGTVDHSIAGNGLDASNRDDSIYISTWPIKGMYLPDAIASFEVNGTTYLITANEGDAREYLYDNNGNEELSFIDETRVKDLKLDPVAFPYADLLQQNEQLGRLKTSLVDGDTDNDGDHDEIYTYGTRSVTIWNASTGTVVWDSKNDFEQIVKQRSPEFFNSTNDENNFDDRSDDKGPEPEGVTVGMVNGKMYAFVGFERVGGIAMYNISNPNNPSFAHYISTRNFMGDPVAGTSGNLAPEGMVFIPASQSPNRTALLVVTYEVSGSVQIFELGTQEPNTSVDQNTEITGLSVYPNPSKNKVSFNLTNTEEAELIIYNSIGTQVLKTNFNSSVSISKDQLNASGVYFYEVINRGIRTSGKLVIMD